MLMTFDILKVFDSSNHIFLFSVLEKDGLGKIYITRIAILLKKKQESCVIKGRTTTHYFESGKGTRQEDSVSAAGSTFLYLK